MIGKFELDLSALGESVKYVSIRALFLSIDSA